MSPNRSRLLLCTILLVLTNISGSQAQTTHPRRTTLTARQIAQRTLPSVVVLIAERAGRDSVSVGTGFFVDTNIIATNYHVVQNASRISARLIIQGQTLQISEIIGVDKRRDLALLRAEATSPNEPPTAVEYDELSNRERRKKSVSIRLRPLRLGNTKDLAIGDNVYVVGNPEGWEGTFSQGIISGFRRIGDILYVQITAPISHGSSGGPVLNRRGEVIGMATAGIKEGQNLNFAISSSELAEFRKSTRSDNDLSKLDFSGITLPTLPNDVPPVRAGIGMNAFISKGNEYFRLRQYAKAAEEYQAAIRFNPNFAEAHYRLANGYVKLLRNIDAIAAYKTAIAIGDVHRNIPSDDGAIHTYGQIVAARPGYELSRFLIGEAYLKRCWRRLAEQKHAVLTVLKSQYADLLLRDIERYHCEYDFSGVDKVPE